MSKVWGDDDDGPDGMRETYAQTLREDGWLDDEEAGALPRHVRRPLRLYLVGAAKFNVTLG